MTTIEKIARAMVADTSYHPDELVIVAWKNGVPTWEARWRGYVTRARAAVEAMREIVPEHYKAACEAVAACNITQDSPPYICERASWRAAIESILAEKQP